MTRLSLAALAVAVCLPLAACSPSRAIPAHSEYMFPCKDFQVWFQYIGGHVGSDRSGARSVLAAAVTMALGAGKLRRDLAKLQSDVARITATRASKLAPDRLLTIEAVRRVRADCCSGLRGLEGTGGALGAPPGCAITVPDRTAATRTP